MAAAWMGFLHGHVLSSILAIAAPKSSFTSSLAFKHLQALELARHVSTSMRYLSGFLTRPLPQGDYAANARKEMHSMAACPRPRSPPRSSTSSSE